MCALVGATPTRAILLWYSMELRDTYGDPRMDKRHDTVLETLMEQLIEGGAENMGHFTARHRTNLKTNANTINYSAKAGRRASLGWKRPSFPLAKGPPGNPILPTCPPRQGYGWENYTVSHERLVNRNTAGVARIPLFHTCVFWLLISYALPRDARISFPSRALFKSTITKAILVNCAKRPTPLRIRNRRIANSPRERPRSSEIGFVRSSGQRAYQGLIARLDGGGHVRQEIWLYRAVFIVNGNGVACYALQFL